MKQIEIPEVPMENKEISRDALAAKIDQFWRRRSYDRSRRSLCLISYCYEYCYAGDNSQFPEGFIYTFAEMYQEAMVDRAEISLLKHLMTKISDAEQLKILKGLIHKLYKSDTADVNEIALLKDIIVQHVRADHQITLLEGIITGHSEAEEVELELDDDDTLAHLIMAKLLKAYGVHKPYVDHIKQVKSLFAPNRQPAPPRSPRLPRNKSRRAAPLKVQMDRANAFAGKANQLFKNTYKN